MFHHFHPPFFEGLATTAMKAVSAIKPREGSVLSIGQQKSVRLDHLPKSVQTVSGWLAYGFMLQSHLGKKLGSNSVFQSSIFGFKTV